MSVPYDEAVRRIREGAKDGRVTDYKGRRVYNFSQLARFIWPDNERRSSQGSALAVGRILNRLLDDGVLRPSGHGYVVGTKANAMAVICPTCGVSHIDESAKELRATLRRIGATPIEVPR